MRDWDRTSTIPFSLFFVFPNLKVYFDGPKTGVFIGQVEVGLSLKSKSRIER